MRYKLDRLPYYVIKLFLMPLGLGNIATYWEEKQGYKKVTSKLNWAYSNYSKYDVPVANNILQDKIIWIYWNQGVENAPDIVKKCIASADTFKGDREIIILTKDNIHKYVVLPDFIESKHNQGIISEAHYSDILRIQLLILYGGIWMDATCYNTSELPFSVENSNFFMFSTGNWWPWMKNISKCSNWYIKSQSKNLLLQKLRNFLFEHWKRRNTPIHYYVFHFALTALTEFDQECKKIWDDVPFISNMNPHLFMYSAKRVYNKHQYEYILSQCFIHKCSYKFDKVILLEKKTNFLQHFLNEHHGK